LPTPRHAFDQDVPARHRRDQHPVDHLRLPDHDLGHLAAEGVEVIAKARQELLIRTDNTHRLGPLIGDLGIWDENCSEFPQYHTGWTTGQGCRCR
jgi:hypothetical protein